MKYQCPDCPFLYNEEEGDPDNGISPGTKFEDLPVNWICPICEAEKAGFEQQEQIKRPAWARKTLDCSKQ